MADQRPTQEQRSLLASLTIIAEEKGQKVVTRTCPPLNDDVPKFLGELDAFENDPKRPSLMVTQPPASDLDFMLALEKDLLAGEPSADPLIKRYPNATPGGAVACLAEENLWAPPLNPNTPLYFR